MKNHYFHYIFLLIFVFIILLFLPFDSGTTTAIAIAIATYQIDKISVKTYLIHLCDRIMCFVGAAIRRCRCLLYTCVYCAFD